MSDEPKVTVRELIPTLGGALMTQGARRWVKVTAGADWVEVDENFCPIPDVSQSALQAPPT